MVIFNSYVKLPEGNTSSNILGVSFCIFCIESFGVFIQIPGILRRSWRRAGGFSGASGNGLTANHPKATGYWMLARFQFVPWNLPLYIKSYKYIYICIYISHISHFWYTISAIVTNHIFFQKFIASSTEAALAQELDRVLYITDAWWQWRKHHKAPTWRVEIWYKSWVQWFQHDTFGLNTWLQHVSNTCDL